MKLQGSQNDGTKLEVLAQIGQLRLMDRLSVDIVTEQVSADVPSETYTPGAQTPLLELTDTSLVSVGFRLRWKVSGLDGAPVETKRERSECLTEAAVRSKEHAVNLKRAPGADAAVLESRQTKDRCDKVGVDVAKQYSEKERIAYYTEKQAEDDSGFVLTAGGRFLYLSEDISGNAPGAAAEITPEYAASWGSLFASGSFLWLTGSEPEKKEDNEVVDVTAQLLELRATAGVIFRFNAPIGSTQLAPRVGAYYTYSTNFWENQFAAPGVDKDIRGHQHEAGLFFSGQFVGGFNGLVQFSVREPYGPDSKPELLVTVVPSLGTDFGVQ